MSNSLLCKAAKTIGSIVLRGSNNFCPTCNRVLKLSGWAIIQVPLGKNRREIYEGFSIVDPQEREKAFGQPDYVRWYGLDYAQHLAAAGFQVSVERFAQTFSDADLFKIGLQSNEDIYFCTKKGG